MSAPSQNIWDMPNQTVDNQEQKTGTASAIATKSDNPAPSGNGDSGSGAKLTSPAAAMPRSRRGLSIGIKATVLAIIFGVLPVIAVGTIAYRSADNEIRERVAQQELEEVDQIAQQLSQYIQERIANVNTVATITNAFPVFKSDLEPEDKARLEALLADQLTAFVQDYRTYSSISVFDVQGNLLVQSSGSALELNQGSADYFQQVLQTGSPAVSEPITIAAAGDSTNRFLVYVGAPVISNEGENAGEVEAVVTAQIPVNFIGNAVLRSGVSTEEEEEEAEFYRLVDSAGNIMQSLPSNPDDSVIGSPMVDDLPRFDAVREGGELIAWIGPTSFGEALNTYAPVSGLSGLNWSVVASESTAEAFAERQLLLRTIVVGSLITGIIAALLGILLARRATRPIEQVAMAIELLGKGRWHARVPIKGNDELAVLGTNVNYMAGQIQGLLQNLSQNARQLGLQNDVLSGLARNEALIQGDAQATAEAFSEAASTTLDVDRVSVWLYEVDQSRLRCLHQYDRNSLSGQPQPLVIATAPAYFETIAVSQGLIVGDVRSHAVAQELIAEGHLAPATVSLMEVPIQIAGNFVGTIRCEHSGSPRTWQPQEQTFLNSIANLISLALESEVLQSEVGHLLDVVSDVEDGNLKVQATVSDRTTGLVADTLNRLIERLADVLQQAVTTTEQVSQSAQQQKYQAGLIATNAEQQSEGVNQILQITDWVTHLAQDAARQVETSRVSLQTLQKTVEQGQAAITTMTTDIDVLQEGSDRIIQQMKTLGEFVGLADQFVQDQTQIASLTQTLALNASLVAARAAEQRDPRQFAVAAREFSSIANQVSQLAQQTNDSLTTLEQRSAQIQSAVFTVDANVQRVGSLVEGFTQGVEQSNQVFEDVQIVTVEAVEAEAVVFQASQEIVNAVQSATEVIRTITDIASQTAELTQDNRMQSEQMEVLSQKLLQTMVFFQLPTAIAPASPPTLVAASPNSETPVSP